MGSQLSPKNQPVFAKAWNGEKRDRVSEMVNNVLFINLSSFHSVECIFKLEKIILNLKKKDGH